MNKRLLPRSISIAIDRSRALRVRAGTDSTHRFISVWPIVIDGRVFVRSWTVRRGGWYRTFKEDPRGMIQVGEREIPVRAIPVRSERIRGAMELAYAEKYPTPGSRKYVRGFRTARRREATMELLARRP